jgi:hypothetical protein
MLKSLKRTSLTLFSIVVLGSGTSIVALVIEPPEPAQAACGNWLCGWENQWTATAVEARDKKVVKDGFTYLRGFALLIELALLLGALFTRDDKERMQWFLGGGGIVLGIALVMNMSVGYVYGDGKDKGEKEAVLPDQIEQLIAMLDTIDEDYQV